VRRDYILRCEAGHKFHEATTDRKPELSTRFCPWDGTRLSILEVAE
jgi:hypothetical protein